MKAGNDKNTKADSDKTWNETLSQIHRIEPFMCVTKGRPEEPLASILRPAGRGSLHEILLIWG